MSTATTEQPPGKTTRDFWMFWAGQTISNLGNSFTTFALPLIAFELTGSAVSLALVLGVEYLPYLFFGLLLGAWADRVDRKRLMIAVDLLRALLISSIGLLFALGSLPIWWIYVVGFLNATLSIAFDAAQFAAIPSLVSKADLLKANGRIQASHSAAFVIGPVLAGLSLTVFPIFDLPVLDGLSFLLSAVFLVLVRGSFNSPDQPRTETTILQDVREGLRYVFGHPVLRNISFMIALVNLIYTTATAQLVLFAKERLQASDSQIGLLYSAGAAGVVLLSLAAPFFRKYLPFSKIILGTVLVQGLLTILFANNTSFWLAVPLWGLLVGITIFFSVNTNSLRQAIVPNHMLGRVMSVAGFVAWSSIPIGTFLGGLLIDRIQNVALVYTGIGVLVCCIPAIFLFSALGRAEQYLEQPQIAPREQVALHTAERVTD